MKTIHALLSSVVILVLFSCGKGNLDSTPEPGPQPPAEVKVTGVSLNKTELTLMAGLTQTLVATVEPNKATDKTVTWESSNGDVASVKDGVVTALKEGTATITARAQDKSATCAVTVTEEVKVTGVSLNKTELTLMAGLTQTLVATVEPNEATDKTVTWESSNGDVASVKDGVVTALKEGTATITARAQDKSATCAVTVTEATITFTLSSSDAAILKAAGGNSTATLTSFDSWTATSSESWLTISPASGSAGVREITLTTASNADGGNRVAKITITAGSMSRTFEIKQRADIFTRTLAYAGKVTQGVKLSYDMTQFTRIYLIMPQPVSNFYQDISNSTIISGATGAYSPDGMNRYIWRDLNNSDVPKSGGFVISNTYDANVYQVSTDFSKIDDIPDYDPDSEECKNYLGKEPNGLIDPTHSKIVSTANSLWTKANGDLIEYAHKCHDWTYDHMTYGKMNTGLHTIEELMTDMTGDCGNYASVFISLLRAKNIPARHIVMVDGKVDDSFHVRAEFYIPGYGWIPSDPTWGKNYFGWYNGSLIVMTTGINTYARGPQGSDIMIEILQNFNFWYWCSAPGRGINFIPTCLGLQ